jgi:hypothetical protein
MIPFKDNIPSRTVPIINLLLIAANVTAFFYELSLGRGLNRLFMLYGVVPARVLAWPHSHASLAVLLTPFVTSMFLHAGWLHLIGNMWYLWIFGHGVEDRLGHLRYLVFYMLCGFGAGIVQTLMSTDSRIPSIGASGAIAGVLGAYIVTHPMARVLTLVPIIFFIQIIEIPAFIVLGVWFLFQFLAGTASLQETPAATGGIAVWAHIGGFMLGMALLALMAPPARSRYGYNSR